MSGTHRCILGIIITAIVTAPTLFAHLAVTRTLPEAESTVAPPPAIQVWFTQAPELSVSALTLQNGEQAVALGHVEAGAANSLVASVPEPLGAGTYTVEWRTAGDDGHVLRGGFSFSVSSAAGDR